ncbi:MAG: DsbC family protein [Halioglobus sp.]
MKFRTLQVALLSAVMSLFTVASVAQPVSKAVQESLTKALESGNQGLQVDSIRATQMPGIFEVELANGPILYSTEKGDFFIAGDLYAVTPDGYVNLAEQRRDAQRVERLASVDTKDMIVFSPQGKPRAYVNVFTDVTCYYCQKLHAEVPELNRLGIEVRYLAYPRAGAGSDGFYKLETAWCASNPQDVLTRLKNKEQVPTQSCDNPIASQYQLGQELGVRGTPAIITQDGKMIPGYQSATDLIASLGLK